ncbi:TPA: preprotein translocase subunit SecA, partial [Candidatus Wolfebacteria bacterium]|nr:preprotein translocase subunit SecA [Candidatus Wolfebacteria bacterium]
MRAYAQHDPLVEYRRESYHLFQDLIRNYDDWIFYNIWKILPQLATTTESPVIALDTSVVEDMSGKIGRNDLCYCGSGKKFKKCH